MKIKESDVPCAVSGHILLLYIFASAPGLGASWRGKNHIWFLISSPEWCSVKYFLKSSVSDLLSLDHMLW